MNFREGPRKYSRRDKRVAWAFLLVLLGACGLVALSLWRLGKWATEAVRKHGSVSRKR